MALTPRPIDFGTIINTLDGINNITNIDLFNRQKPALVQAVNDLRTHLTDQQSQIDNLTTQTTQLSSQIASLTSERDQLKQDNAAKQATIDRLTAAAASAPTTKPLDLASSFQGVIDTIHQQALQSTATTASTIKSLDVEIKGLVTVQTDATGAPTPPAFVLPAPDKPIDPAQLSTMRLSFATIPVVTPRPSAAPPRPEPPIPVRPIPTPGSPAAPPSPAGEASPAASGERPAPGARAAAAESPQAGRPKRAPRARKGRARRPRRGPTKSA